jgi:hypothetical protein
VTWGAALSHVPSAGRAPTRAPTGSSMPTRVRLQRVLLSAQPRAQQGTPRSRRSAQRYAHSDRDATSEPPSGTRRAASRLTAGCLYHRCHSVRRADSAEPPG